MLEQVLDIQELETIPIEVKDWYLKYAKTTWNSIDSMNYPETGLPSDHLHYAIDCEDCIKIDKTSPTNIGFYLASIGAAHSLGFITEQDALERVDSTLSSIETMMKDTDVFLPTSDDKGLFVNWIQPSTGKVLKKWPTNECPVKQQLSSVDNAWLIAFSKLTSSKFPQFQERIEEIIEQVDLEFMFNKESGYFKGCFVLGNNSGFEDWEYNEISEARIAYLLRDEELANQIEKLINNKNEDSYFSDPENPLSLVRKTWNGEFFSLGWPYLLVPEGELNKQWEDTLKKTIEMHRKYGKNGYYGYTAGLSPDGNYKEFRVSDCGVNPVKEPHCYVITISALLNMGIIEPIETYHQLNRLQLDYPQLFHPNTGCGDTVDVETGKVQRDQLLPNQAASLLSCWNIINNNEAQRMFMQTVPANTFDVYTKNSLL
jgi:hypothetical protein